MHMKVSCCCTTDPLKIMDAKHRRHIDREFRTRTHHQEGLLTMNTARIFLTATLAAGAVALPAAGASAATPGPAPTFGHHVSACAQTMVFSGALNPGMHQGITAWDDDTTTCPTP